MRRHERSPVTPTELGPEPIFRSVGVLETEGRAKFSDAGSANIVRFPDAVGGVIPAQILLRQDLEPQISEPLSPEAAAVAIR